MTMQVSCHKFECIREWVHLILPNRTLTEDTEQSVLHELLQLIHGNRTPPNGTTSEIDFVLNSLTELYELDIRHLLEPTKTDDKGYSLFGRCCLFLLILAMGLRRKSKLFMSAAFKLPHAMHFDIVEMTQPLIDESPISLLAFANLSEDSENQPTTPICRKPLPKVPGTCPVACNTTSVSKRFASMQSHLLSPERTFPVKPYARRMGRSLVISDEPETTDSPLYSLKQTLDTPGLISKSDYLSKLEEIRSLNAQNAALQDLYDETCSELQQLSVAHHSLELKHKELEVKFKRRELELTELKDELTCERESRRACEDLVQHSDSLRERLTCALEELKTLSGVKAENNQLREEVTKLRCRVKSLQNLRPRIVDYELLQQQVAVLKENLRIADERFLQLICEREENLTAASQTQSVNSSRTLDLRSPQSPPATGPSGTLSPDSSQPGLANCATPEGGSLSPIPTPKSSLYGPESLASVVAVNSQLQELETALSSSRADLQFTKSQLVHWQCRAIAAQALSSHRLEMLTQVQCALQSTKEELALKERCLQTKVTTIETQISSAYSRLNNMESTVQAYATAEADAHLALTTENAELRAAMRQAEVAADEALRSTREELLSCKEAEHLATEEVKRLKYLLDEVRAECDRQAGVWDQKKSALEFELTQLQDSLREKSTRCERVSAQLKEQVEANAAYRKATEQENDRLRHQISSLSAEHSAYKMSQEQQYQSLKIKLTSELELLRETNETSSRQCASLRTVLEHMEQQLERETKKSEASLALVSVRDKELSELRSSHADVLARLNLTQEQLTKETLEVQRLTSARTELDSRLTSTEEELRQLEARSQDLTHRNVFLESECTRFQERLKQQQIRLESFEQDRTEMERRATLLRDQLHQIESDWMHSQAQLAQTRSQLTQVEQALHETRLQLQRMEYTRAETSERLSRLESGGLRREGRLVRSTISLCTSPRAVQQDETTAMPDECRQTEHSEAHESPGKTSEGVASLTFISPLPPTTSPVTKQTRDAAVQKCLSHVSKSRLDERTRRILRSNPVGSHWPPFADSTAPVSPENLKQGHVLTGAEHLSTHSRRFGRFLLDTDDELAGLGQRSMPKPGGRIIERKRGHDTEGVRARVCPDGELDPDSIDLKVKPVDCIPETPLPWNAPSTFLFPASHRSVSVGNVVVTSRNEDRHSIGNDSLITLDRQSVISDMTTAVLPSHPIRQMSIPDSSAAPRKLRKFWKVKKTNNNKRWKHREDLVESDSLASSRGASFFRSLSFSSGTANKSVPQTKKQ